MTALSGLVATSLAPASFAAPSDSQDTKSETQVSAAILSYPGSNGPTRIHFITTTGTADAILLESRGVFGMIDGGEGVGAPNGSDPRYPKRPGITAAERGDTDWVLGYMAEHGVTSSNLAFYLGTHAHSDHIDNADDIIKKFHPKVILSPEYSDKWITNPNGL
jgi:choline binding protein E